MILSPQEATSLVKAKALDLGFDDVGISEAVFLQDDASILQEWLNNGYHSSMGYMENHFDKRVDASKLVEGAVSVISVIKNYYPAQKQNPDAPVVAKYAYGNDYHEVLKPLLNQLLDFIRTSVDAEVVGRCFCDSAPLLERAYAKRAGLGWIGKNSNLIHKRLGSFFFIAEVVVSTPMVYDEPIKEACGGCTRCIDACPTKAIVHEGVIDSNRCISFQTIENKGDILNVNPADFKNRLFGCDICQDVCPWNWKARPHTFTPLDPNHSLINLTEQEWKMLTEEEFAQKFRRSPLKRTKFSGIQRNLRFLGSNI